MHTVLSGSLSLSLSLAPKEARHYAWRCVRGVGDKDASFEPRREGKARRKLSAQALYNLLGENPSAILVLLLEVMMD